MENGMGRDCKFDRRHQSESRIFPWNHE